ncbi:MAG: thioredoxin-disulfide reductase [Elusimicrobiaceae bacterium]|jgi:thioredoxin reductase (NADPH)|nr:thioredoxin-disulfide reductase [Elusimicrobiaceae bacterium]MBT3955053.1 thioredoxin-disulfide reductase [Elusimicrobiaceae bacterium]MBT4007823.1 thioredoxin-disulfide reductase [Elusimicrobiaceae bacterium]MBT4402839.1 thioredoxin-disulfide reductase [Elusimicrobiaceae bacterium]MBT4440252.1 thioredoxin-disulfide reductase [Elusimicrobiaceae bacterium]
MKTDVLIIGAGPAGCAGALYTVRAGLKTVILGGTSPGGQLLKTQDIENYPGFENPIGGFDLMEAMHKQCKRLGAELTRETATKIETSEKPYKVHTKEGKIYTAKAIIIATGSEARWLGIPSEEPYKNKGVSACATCDGFFFKGKEVVIVGGGNTAFEDALFLAEICPKVTIVHRREGFRAENVLIEKVKANPKIEMKLCNVVDEILGDDKGITSIKIKDVTTEKISELKCEGIFVAIGSIPQTEFLKGSGVELEDDGHIKADSKTKTNIEGIFAGGDCADSVYRQAITSAGTGAQASLEVISYINSL